jgi:hypothetical protein
LFKIVRSPMSLVPATATIKADIRHFAFGSDATHSPCSRDFSSGPNCRHFAASHYATKWAKRFTSQCRKTASFFAVFDEPRYGISKLGAGALRHIKTDPRP